MATVVQRLTYEEWLEMPPVEDGTDEVVNGELRFMAPTRYSHAEIIRRLTRSLDRQLDDTRAVVFGSNLGLMISREPLTCRSPDMVVYWLEKMVIQDGLYWSAPDLVIEIISPSENRCRKQEKLADYAAIGTPEAWVVFPKTKTVEVHLLKDGKLERTAILGDGSLQPSQFAGVTISIPSLFPA
jgi:Uma2 family endonuclease